VSQQGQNLTYVWLRLVAVYGQPVHYAALVTNQNNVWLPVPGALLMCWAAYGQQLLVALSKDDHR
jgi:hypothetical protein